MEKSCKHIVLCLIVGVINLFCGCQTTRQCAVDGTLIAMERHLKTGDLLFAFDPRGNAITAVTSGVQGLKIDHVGIVLKDKKQVVVAEATSRKGVILTPLAEFLTHNTIPGDRYPSVVRGRLKTNFDETMLRTRVNHYLGLPYDSLYMPDDSAMYCSELVQKCYVSKGGKAIFPTIPMSFHDASGQITPYWKAFYAQRHKAVPEGMSGTNPGQLSRDSVLKISALPSF